MLVIILCLFGFWVLCAYLVGRFEPSPDFGDEDWPSQLLMFPFAPAIFIIMILYYVCFWIKYIIDNKDIDLQWLSPYYWGGIV